jgi:16S rRNA (guanine966-N2)-methyltransferase
MPRHSPSHRAKDAGQRKAASEDIQLRIIAGHLRSRKLQFECDARTRPMKDRTREAVMNLLGGTLTDTIAFDLFGGSGILAFEAISRGSRQAVVWEILKRGAVAIRNAAQSLGISNQVQVLSADIFDWTEQWDARWEELGLSVPPEGLSPPAWVVFVCPPYAFWETDGEQLKALITTWYQRAPTGSLFAVELEVKTPETWLPEGPEWDIRSYAPAKMAIAEKRGT